MYKYSPKPTGGFKRDYRKVLKQGKNRVLIEDIIEKLANGEELPAKNKDHALRGKWKGYRECHIEPDWLLVYKVVKDKLILLLVHTDSHSELF